MFFIIIAVSQPRYCAYQERCHQEVLIKLQGMKVYGNQADTVISYLIEQNYLNETRFAEYFVRGKFRIKKWGKNRWSLNNDTIIIN